MSERNATLTSWLLGKAKSGSVAAGGKQSLHAMLAGAGAEAVSPFNMALMGGFGVVSAVSNQIEYNHERGEITDFYREELAAKNNKTLAQVADADLSAAEKNNATINEAVGRERNIRNLGIAASFVASIAIYTLMTLVVGHSAGSGALITSNPMAAAVIDFTTKAALGGLAYLAAKVPLMKAGTALFGLDKDTAHDLIVDITRDREKGKSITREQVVEVFISGNKQLSAYVEKSFGSEYEELPLADKVRVANTLANILPIDKIVDSINHGTTKASELAYTVQGDVSGVLPKTEMQPKKHGLIEKCAQKCKQLAKYVGGMFTSEKAHPIDTIEAIAKTQHEHKKKHDNRQPELASPIAELNNTPSHVERLGPRYQHHEHGKSQVQQLAERNAHQVVMPGSPTLQ